MDWVTRPLGVCGAAVSALSALVTACGGGDNLPPVARIEFQAVPNVVDTCARSLTSWTVSARETGATGTADCERSILFVHLSPYATYTFDIEGYSGAKLCWEGTCKVAALPGTTLPDCSGHIDDLCPH